MIHNVYSFYWMYMICLTITLFDHLMNLMLNASYRYLYIHHLVAVQVPMTQLLDWPLDKWPKPLTKRLFWQTKVLKVRYPEKFELATLFQNLRTPCPVYGLYHGSCAGGLVCARHFIKALCSSSCRGACPRPWIFLLVLTCKVWSIFRNTQEMLGRNSKFLKSLPSWYPKFRK